MNAPANQSAAVPSRGRSLSGPVPRRVGIVQRRRRARSVARQRTQAHVRRPLSTEQRRRPPLERQPAWIRGLAAVAAVGGSAAAHLVIVALGAVTAALNLGVTPSEEGPVTFEVREVEKPEPPPEPPPPEPEPAPATPPVAVRPLAMPKPETTETPADEERKPAPLRVVGLSLEATVEGSGGPAFAVGETRFGETAPRAAGPRPRAPKDAPVAAPNTPPPAPVASPNRIASRIPTAKVEYTMPKRKRPRLPPYPSTLRSQGIEADVTVLVSLNASGRVTQVTIVAPSPYPEFNEAARSTALGEEFEPARRDGVPVPYTLSYTYRFRIEER